MYNTNLSEMLLTPYQPKDRPELERIAQEARVLRYTGFIVATEIHGVRCAVSPAHPDFKQIAPLQHSLRNLTQRLKECFDPASNDQRNEDHFSLRERDTILGFSAFWNGEWKNGTMGDSHITFAFVKPEYSPVEQLQLWLQNQFWNYLAENRRQRRIGQL